MKKQFTMVGLAAACLTGMFAACGGSDGDQTSGKTGSGGAGTTQATGSGTGSNSGGSTGEGFGTTGAGTGAASGAGGEASCAGEKSSAELVPLDLYIMLDKSGSMDEDTGTGLTKWEAVTQALGAFFNDPQSSGLGAGLQYFPLADPAVPDSCTSDAQCGPGGPCVFRVCRNQATMQGITQPCANNGDCPSGDTCVQLGACANTGELCLPANSNCAFPGGRCNALTTSFCAEPDSCEAGVYGTPDVEIAQLNGAANALIDSIADHGPEGATPTSAALAGAIEHARAYASDHPDHKVVAVLATDGLPTECSPLEADAIAQLAADGLGGSPSISTFVIGVFDGVDTTGPDTMNQIAAAGGTTQAFIIDATTDVSGAFREALNAIRGESLACEYQVPVPSDGQMIDYNKVNVEHTPGGASTANTIFYVGSLEQCDPATGGWYYDVDPTTGERPTKLVMCPATCTVFKQGGQVDISVGCKTEIPPPR